jgi:hypothetical protein
MSTYPRAGMQRVLAGSVNPVLARDVAEPGRRSGRRCRSGDVQHCAR